MSLFFTRKILNNKEKKFLIWIILFSLIHNFIIFPVQTAEAAELDLSNGQKFISSAVLKSPDSSINTLEQLHSANSNNDNNELPSVVQDFKLIKQEKTKETKKFAATKGFTPVSVPMTGNSRLVSMTAYNSEVAQTDGDPCTTANGFNVCKHGVEDTVAANFLPFGTRIQAPDLFGDRVFVVRDRMARRYTNRVDFWFLSKSDALKFGVRQSRIVVLAN